MVDSPHDDEELWEVVEGLASCALGLVPVDDANLPLGGSARCSSFPAELACEGMGVSFTVHGGSVFRSTLPPFPAPARQAVLRMPSAWIWPTAKMLSQEGNFG